MIRQRSPRQLVDLAGGIIALLVFLAGGGSALAAPSGGKTSTGQGIMVNLLGSGTFAASQTDTYQYNTATAAGYFTNLWDQVVPSGVAPNHFSSSSSTATVLQATAPSVQSACTPPAPDAPAAPDPLLSELIHQQGGGQDDVVGSNKCNFLDNATLTGKAYTQTSTAPSSCQYISKVVCTKAGSPPACVAGSWQVTTTTVSGPYTYTYNYVIAPKPELDGDSATGGVQPGVLSGDPLAVTDSTLPPDFVTTFPVAWDLSSSGGVLAHVDVDADIAGLSVISSAKTPRKFSFSMEETDPVTGLPVNRVQNLVVTVDGIPYPTGSTVVKNTPGSTPNLTSTVGAVILDDTTSTCGTCDHDFSLDFFYKTNAGSNGLTSLLTYGAYGENQDARTTLNNDSFSGNNNGGADGSALTIVFMDTVGVDLGGGDHNVTLTGTVKGNSATADLSFAVTETLTVVHPGCATP